VEPIDAFDHVSASEGTRFARQREELEARLTADDSVPDSPVGIDAPDSARTDGNAPKTAGLTDEGVSWRA